jgi:hypothetical protein
LRKGLAVGAVSLLAVPIFSLAVSAGIGARANPLLWKAAILLLGATMGVPGVLPHWRWPLGGVGICWYDFCLGSYARR